MSDNRGTIAIIFALTAAIVFALVGGAVDYGRWLSARSKTLHAMDAAVLAAGRVLQLDQTNEAGALAAAQRYYNQNKSSLLDSDTINFSVQNGEIIVSMSASSIKTPFLSIAGISSLPVNNVSKAELAVGGNAGTHIEISLMLDTTGSMRGQKMVALKQAAIDLVNIVVWQDQSEFTSRVAVVPFSQYVNLERAAFAAAANHSPQGNSTNRTCVKERSGNKRYKDSRPNTRNGYFDYYTSNSACRPQASVLPLTSDKQQIQQRINEMQPQGSTAGHLGTAWAWYALSPRFRNVWPSDSRPKGYGMLTQMNDSGQPKLRKIAILMTDGEYNTQYSGSDSTTQARELCVNMKATGITVYTVGFELSNYGQAKQTLQQCASSPDHFYDASNADALKLAFRDIALKISTLRLAE